MNQVTRASVFLLLLSSIGINFSAGEIHDGNFLIAKWYTVVCPADQRENLYINIYTDFEPHLFTVPFKTIMKIRFLSVAIHQSWFAATANPSSMALTTESDLKISMPETKECSGYLRIRVSKGWNGQAPTIVLSYRPILCPHKAECDVGSYGDLGSIITPTWYDYHCGLVKTPQFMLYEDGRELQTLHIYQRCIHPTTFEHEFGSFDILSLPMSSLINTKFKYNNSDYEIIRNGQKQRNYFSDLQAALQRGKQSFETLWNKDEFESKTHVLFNCPNGYHCINFLDSLKCRCQQITHTENVQNKLKTIVPEGINFPLINHINVSMEEKVKCIFGEKSIFPKDLSCICFSSSFAGPHCEIDCRRHCKSKFCIKEDEVQCLHQADDGLFVKYGPTPVKPVKHPHIVPFFIYGCVMFLLDLVLLPLCVAFAVRWKRRWVGQRSGFHYSIQRAYGTEERPFVNQTPVPQTPDKKSFVNDLHNHHVKVEHQNYSDLMLHDVYETFSNEYEYPNTGESTTHGKSSYNDAEKKLEASVSSKEDRLVDNEEYDEIGVYYLSDANKK